MSSEPTVNSNRRSLVALFGIGFFPLVISWIIFFYFPQLMPSSTTNEGDLITPPVHASELGIESQIGEWTLVMPVGNSCESACMERLYLARQVNVALGKEAPRVHRLLISTSPTLNLDAITAEYPDLAIANAEMTTIEARLGLEGQIFLMDPLGNIFMVYSQEKAGKPMLKDIKHLLKISNIG